MISGFLITSIIIKEIREDKFSFTHFYARRIRRILPLSLFVILVTLFAGYFITLPAEYSRTGGSALYASFGISNFYFLWHTGYFDTSSKYLPLLHTWSLAVEEQYYLIWPLLLIGIVKIGKGANPTTISLIILLLLVGLAVSQYAVIVDQKTAFYMLHSRAWELLLGGLLALAPTIRNRFLSEILPIIGLLLIAWSLLYLNSKTPFPGINAIYPCLGAALIILPKQNTHLTERLLSASPLVFLGKISYSLYLWHWPILVLYRQYGTRSLPALYDALILLLICFVLSVLTWKYIEQAFRKKISAVRSPVLISGIGAMLGVGSLWFGVSNAAGFPGRIPEPLREVEKMINETVTSQNGMGSCFITSQSKNGIRDYSPEDCIVINPEKRNVLIVGDSHAAHFGKALRDIFPDTSFSQITNSGCLPALYTKNSTTCSTLMRRAINEYIPSGEFDTVIFSGRWTVKGANNLVGVIEQTKRYVENVVVFGPTVEYTKELPILVAKSALRNDNGQIIESARRYNNSKKRARFLVSKLKDLDVEYYSVIESVCPKKECIIVDADGKPIQFDYGHSPTVAHALSLSK